MISIHLENQIVAILDLDERELTVDEVVQRLRLHGQFPAPANDLGTVRRDIQMVIQGYFSHQLETGETDATDISPH